MDTVFQVTRWCGESQTAKENAEVVRGNLPQGTEVWGIWSGLFGLSSRELLVVTVIDDNNSRCWREQSGIIEEQFLMVPTARPTSTTPPEKDGLYVFRFFETQTQHIDEIATLSQTAWQTFENTTDYSAEPQALFAPVDRSSPHATMLLITWYNNFDSWLTSRQPHPDARENFMRRRALTTNTLPIATQLVKS